MRDQMSLRGARTNNLKNINVDIPLKQMTVITGVSGSGKSSLAFDTLYAEGQRRYAESLSTYIRQFLEKIPRPDIDSLDNVSPAIALEQKNTINNSRSTVATMSEIYDYLRIFFAKVGKTYCTTCGTLVRKDTPTSVAEALEKNEDAARFYVLSPLSDVELAPKEWPTTRKTLVAAGFERVLLQDEVQEITALEKLPKKPGRMFLVIDRMGKPENPRRDHRLLDALEQAFSRGSGRATLAIPPSGQQTWKFYNYSDRFRCDHCDIDYRVPDPQLLSFNSPLGACTGCNGFGFTLELSENLIVPDARKTIKGGAIDPFTKPAFEEMHGKLLKFCEKHGIPVGKRYEDLPREQKDLLWNGTPQDKKEKYLGVRGFFEDLKEWKYKMYIRIFIRRYQEQVLCTSCKGARLRPQALAVKIAGLSIADVLKLPIEEAKTWFESLKLTKSELEVAKDLTPQIRGRLEFLHAVGVGYLTMDRLAKTLSGGECQRIYLASQLGNRLCSTLYVLDEPSIGLHAADTERLIGLLQRLRDHGNTVVIVEHDLDVIRSADHLIELGPMAGHRGGEVVVQGNLQQVLKDKSCLTAKYLTKTLEIPKRATKRPPPSQYLKITGACENNLKDVTVEFPLKRLVTVTGLSGSGKTTLVHHTLHNALTRLFHKENVPVGRFSRIYGTDLINDVVLLDQKPIGKTSRSNPATYLKIYDDIRKVYANQSLSLRRGYGPQFFSFNVDGGRCPVCKGEGEITLDMHFMAEVKLPCEECQGRRFKKDVLEVEFKKKNISDLLGTTIDECIDLFREYPAVSNRLQLLKSVGLGYLQLGQSGTTLSGGESQRLKVASVLSDRKASEILYIFDEPTTGLHIDDVKRLVSVLQDLVDNDNSVLVIEHNLDLIAQSDYIIDMGPGAGKDGGQVVAAGPPEIIMANPQSLTGQFLKKAQSL